VGPGLGAAARPPGLPPAGLPPPAHPDRIVFDKLIQILVFGCGYRRIADTTCSATTLRRRRDEWISAGVAEQLRRAVLAAYDQLFGLELEHLAVDGCISKAPSGGQVAGPSPVDRRKQGLKRSVATEACGIPLVAVPAPANHRDDGLLAATLDAVGLLGSLPQRPTVHLDAGYDWRPGRQILSERGMVGQIATRGKPAPVQASRRWPVEQTHAWVNQYGKLRWCTERRRLGWWSSGLRWSTPLLSAGGWSVAPGPATAGTADPAAAHDLLAAALRKDNQCEGHQ
jgi:transposase